ncbi:MAG: MFS transporter [Hyphomicrobiales bacterium]|nr:MFS transporter [Hyphomicrobiales bacterium]MDE2016594.1 MFS transporter [Hyphomicrobiales bacterium]
MLPSPRIEAVSTASRTRRLSAFYAAHFAGLGIFGPYGPALLSALGLDAAGIGWAFGLYNFARIAAMPLGAAWGETRIGLARTIVWCSAATAACLAALGFAHGLSAITLVMVALSIVRAPVIPITDGLAMAHAAGDGGGRPAGERPTYASMRAWGSFAFLVAAGLGGVALTGASATTLALAMTLTAVAAAVAAFFVVAPVPKPRHADSAREPFRPGRRLVATIVAAALVQGSHGMVATFGTLHWTARGFPGALVGGAWAAAVATEIAVLSLSGRVGVAPRHGPALMLAGAAAGTIRWIAMGFDPPGWGVLALQSLHGGSFAMTFLGSALAVDQAAGEGRRARAQGALATASAVANACAVMASGPLYARFGERAYLAMAAMTAAGFALTAALAALPARAPLSRPGPAL